MSIDPGFKRLGYALWEKDNLMDSGSVGIEREEGEPWTEYVTRGVLFFYDWFYDYMLEAERGGQIEKIVVEQLPPVSSSPSFNASTQTTLVFCAITSLILAAKNFRINIEYVAAQHWRSQFIESKATKAQIRRKVLELFPDIQGERKITEIPFDQTDSIAIGWTYINENNSRKG